RPLRVHQRHVRLLTRDRLDSHLHREHLAAGPSRRLFFRPLRLDSGRATGRGHGLTASGGAPAGVMQGYALLREGRVEEAVRHAADLLREQSDHVDALVLAGEAAVAGGAPDEALGYMQRAIDADPGNEALRLKQAGLLLHLRRRREALDLALSVAAKARGRGGGQA